MAVVPYTYEPSGSNISFTHSRQESRGIPSTRLEDVSIQRPYVDLMKVGEENSESGNNVDSQTFEKSLQKRPNFLYKAQSSGTGPCIPSLPTNDTLFIPSVERIRKLDTHLDSSNAKRFELKSGRSLINEHSFREFLGGELSSTTARETTRKAIDDKLHAACQVYLSFSERFFFDQQTFPDSSDGRLSSTIEAEETTNILEENIHVACQAYYSFLEVYLSCFDVQPTILDNVSKTHSDSNKIFLQDKDICGKRKLCDVRSDMNPERKRMYPVKLSLSIIYVVEELVKLIGRRGRVNLFCALTAINPQATLGVHCSGFVLLEKLYHGDLKTFFREWPMCRVFQLSLGDYGSLGATKTTNIQFKDGVSSRAALDILDGITTTLEYLKSTSDANT